MENAATVKFGMKADGPKKNKEKVFNDFTNKLESRPIIMKSTGQRSGLNMKPRDQVGQGI